MELHPSFGCYQALCSTILGAHGGRRRGGVAEKWQSWLSLVPRFGSRVLILSLLTVVLYVGSDGKTD